MRKRVIWTAVRGVEAPECFVASTRSNLGLCIRRYVITYSSSSRPSKNCLFYRQQRNPLVRCVAAAFTIEFRHASFLSPCDATQ